MKAASATLVILSALLFGAHLLRGGHLALAVAVAVAPALLLFRSLWATRVVRTVLAVAALEWLRTLWTLVDLRNGQGLPFTRLAIILGAVAAVTAGAALCVPSRARASERTA